MQINYFKYVPLILEILYLMTLGKKFGQAVKKLLGGGEEGGGSSPVSDRVKESDRLPRRMQIKHLRWRTWKKY